MKKSTQHVVAVVALIVAAMFALAFSVDVNQSSEAGVRLSLPERLGEWVGSEMRYCHQVSCQKEYTLDQLELDKSICPNCGGELFTMSLVERQELPPDTEFVKARYTNAAGRQVFVSIVLTGRDRESIHRPERCLIGQGLTITEQRTVRVPVDGNPNFEVSVLLNHRNFETPQGPVGQYSYYAYWFAGQHRETPSHLWRMFWLAYDRIVHSVAHRWAYIAIQGRREASGRAYEDEIRNFVRMLRNEIVL